MPESIYEKAFVRAHEGMEIAVIAALDPDRPAIISEHGTMTFSALNQQCNQLAHYLREQGLCTGDPIALLCGNLPEFVIVRFTAHRLGLRLTPINWHLSPEDVSYIVANCDAKVLFADSRAEQQALRAQRDCNLTHFLSIGDPIDGFTPMDQAIKSYDTTDIADPSLGHTMMYTSGTTGRPKGVLKAHPSPQDMAKLQAGITQLFQFQPDTGKDCALATGPLYHAGPFNLCMSTPLTAGITTVLMDKWSPEHMLHLISHHQITHTFCVPTMFVRLLQLDETLRSSFDISSLRFVIHGAAPCSVDTKKAMLDWFGPIIWELFAGTEGSGTFVSPQEWLAKPGTVGKPASGQLKIIAENGEPCRAFEAGTIYIVNADNGKFVYYKDQEKTASVTSGSHYTIGDVGYLDDDGYLFLTGRSAEVIISGGVNLYPQEIDDAIALHPSVADVACVGVPNTDLGEEIKAVIELLPETAPSESLANAIIDFCQAKLGCQKSPRSIDFVTDLPRSEAGKILRKSLRARYWQEQDSDI